MTAPRAYAVTYYEQGNRRWVDAPGRYATREAAEAKADEVRVAGYEARVEQVIFDRKKEGA